MGDSRIRWLLGLAAVLVVLRFVVMPWTQGQDERRQQLEVLTQRLDRSAGVVEDKQEILAAQVKLRAATQASRAIFPQVSDKEAFRLEAQRTLSGIANRGGVRVVLFDWVMDGEAAQAGLAYGRVNANIQGPLDSLVAVHGQIEAEMPFAAVREVKLDVGGSGASRLAPEPATLQFVVDLFYRPAASPAAPAGGGA